MKTHTPAFKEALLIYSTLLAVTFVAYFFWFNKFGLYEDDFVFISRSVNADFSEFLRSLKWIFTDNPEGRIIGFLLPHMSAYALYNIAGIPAIYLFGWIIVSTNGFLLFQLMKKIFPSLLALFVSFFFILSPADTTKGYLTHIYQLQLSVTFLLVGLHLYLKKKYIASHIVAACSLITYEIAFLPFFFAPAMENIQWRGRNYLLRQIKHAVTFTLIVLAVVMWRKFTHEARVEMLVPSDVVLKTIKAFFIGPAVAVYTYLHAIVEAWGNSEISVFFILPSFAFFALFFSFYFKIFTFRNASAPASFGQELNIPLKAILLGGVMLVFSYLFAAPASHYPPDALAGRGTSVHLSASISSAILMGGIFYSLYCIFARYRLRTIFIFLISLLYSSYVGYGGIIQKDFARSWSLQKDFWNQVAQLCPDMGDGTNIIVERKDLPETKYILSHSWADPIILELLFRFPQTWSSLPRLITIDGSLDEDISLEDGRFYFKTPFPWLFSGKKIIELLPENTIYLQAENGTLSRKNNNLIIHRTLFTPKTAGKGTRDFQKENMYHCMFQK